MALCSLELLVSDVMRELSEVCHMKIFFDKLYRLYSASPENCNELKDFSFVEHAVAKSLAYFGCAVDSV